MPIPGEDFLARISPLLTPAPGAWLDDLVAVNFDTVALLEWGQYDPKREYVKQAGNALIRFDPLGKVIWQKNIQLCLPDGRCLFGWQDATLLRTHDGFLVVGTSPSLPESWLGVVAARFKEDGTVMWVKHYRGLMETGVEDGEAIGVAHINGLASDLFLIAAKFGRSSVFFQIDGVGNFVAGTAYRIDDFVVKRLRDTATQGIFALGAHWSESWTGRPYMVCIDPTSGYPRWERIYSTAIPPRYPDLTGPVWYDIAEGADCLMALANATSDTVPYIGYIVRLEKDTSGNPGAVTWARLAPVEFAYGCFWSIVNFQYEPVPLKEQEGSGTATSSSFAVGGMLPRFYDAAWLFRMGEDGKIFWEKMYSETNFPIDRLIWPSYSQIVAGSTILGDPNNAMVVSSRPDPGIGRLFCAKEPATSFVDVEMSSELRQSGRIPIDIATNPWSYRTVDPLPIAFGCLQGAPR